MGMMLNEELCNGRADLPQCPGTPPSSLLSILLLLLLLLPQPQLKCKFRRSVLKFELISGNTGPECGIDMEDIGYG
eukprot:3827301-Rhodomonas_salina.6